MDSQCETCWYRRKTQYSASHCVFLLSTGIQRFFDENGTCLCYSESDTSEDVKKRFESINDNVDLCYLNPAQIQRVQDLHNKGLTTMQIASRTGFFTKGIREAIEKETENEKGTT